MTITVPLLQIVWLTYLSSDRDCLSLEHSPTTAGTAGLTLLRLDTSHVEGSSGVHVQRLHDRLVVVVQAEQENVL